MGIIKSQRRAKDVSKGKAKLLSTSHVFEPKFIGRLIRAIYWHNARDWKATLKETRAKVSPQEASIIKAIEFHEGISQVNLARLLHVKPPTLTPQIDQLEKNGFLFRVRKPSDRRVSALHLSKAGNKVANVVEASLRAVDTRAFGRLSPAEVKQFAEILLKIVATNNIEIPRV